jgi:ATP-binding protein involved in chromosome partitioning
MTGFSDEGLERAVRRALNGVSDPLTGAGLVDAGRIAGLVLRQGGRVGFVLESADGIRDEPLRSAAEAACRAVPGVTTVTAVLTAHSDAPPPPKAAAAAPPVQPPPAQPPPGRRPAKTIIAVASGKGGVGKSSIAANLAVAAAGMGFRTGLMDADVFGPSLPTMFGTVGVRPSLSDNRRIRPVLAHGVHTMSIGYMVAPDNAVAWRGPMVMSAVGQLISETDWDDLDVLFIDTPPGTGEVQLTLVQRLPLDGAVIVSTPQEIALADVRRGIAMFRKTSVPVIGVIENMAWFALPGGERAYLFGQGGARRTAEDLRAPFLGELPILQAVREGADEGLPAAVSDPVVRKAFEALTEAIVSAAGRSGKPLPRIVFE